MWFEGRYRFQWRKNFGWLQRATWNNRLRVRIKSIALLQKLQIEIKKNVVLNCKKMFLLRIDKNVQFNSLFLGNS